MKKMLALTLAAAMTLSMGVTTFAAKPAAPYAENFYMDDDEIQSTINLITAGKGTLDLNGAVPFDEDGDLIFASSDFKSDEDFYVTCAQLMNSPLFNDRDAFKVKFDKDDNADRFRYVLITEKNFPNLKLPYDEDGAFLSEDNMKDFSKWYSHGTGHKVAFRFILKETPSDDEFKISGTATFTAKKDISVFGAMHTEFKLADKDDFSESNYQGTIKKGTKIEIPVKGFVQNEQVGTDHTAAAGDGGVVLKPEENDDNELTWEDNNNTLATLNFSSDDDAAKFAIKMSTKWYGIAPYSAAFADQDAFIRSFMFNPAVPATSRATLELMNPFIDSDGEETIPAEEVVIYTIADGQIVDATAQFTAGENEDGDSVFTLKTRQLGTYILSAPKGSAEEATEAAIPTGLTLPSRG